MEFIDIENEQDVAVITMNHEEDNRFNGPFLNEIRDMLKECEKDSSVKAVVVTGGQEKYFSNGLHLQWMMEQTPDVLRGFLGGVSQILKETALFGKPLIGAINGHAFGLGCIWSCGFDFRIMREDRGWACFPELDINIPFTPGMIAICEHCLGKRSFREMAFSAKRYTGPEAVNIGWANKTASKDALLPEAMELASFMGTKAQPAFSATKKQWADWIVRIIDEQDSVFVKNFVLPGT
jgi:enoyl-CoA hydratase/carnithine racemase